MLTPRMTERWGTQYTLNDHTQSTTTTIAIYVRAAHTSTSSLHAQMKATAQQRAGKMGDAPRRQKSAAHTTTAVGFCKHPAHALVLATPHASVNWPVYAFHHYCSFQSSPPPPPGGLVLADVPPPATGAGRPGHLKSWGSVSGVKNSRRSSSTLTKRTCDNRQ